MKHNVVAILAAFGLVSCGGGGSGSPVAAPVPVASATPAPVAPATPAPTPTPCTQGLCEAPTVNSAPPVQVNLKVYYVQYPDSNDFARCDQSDPIPVGYEVGLDATGRDANNKLTNGSGDIRWEFDNESLVIIRHNQPFQARLRVLAPGRLQAWAILDGVRSNRMALTFQNGTQGTDCR